MRRLLIVRPEPGNSASVERARSRGLSVTGVPLFTIEPVAWKVPDAAAFDALLLTSANAVHAAGEQLAGLRGLPAYTVGQATAAAARDAGFDIAASGDDGVDRLLGSIPAELRLLHLCGEERTAPVSPRQNVSECVVYRAAELREPELGELDDVVVALHSARAAQRLGALIDDRRRTTIAALSPAVAAAAGGGWARVEAADTPDDNALLALAARLCDNPRGE